MKTIIAFSILLVFSFWSCNKPSSAAGQSTLSSEKSILIDFRVDSVRAIPLDIKERSFVLMLPAEKNILWYADKDGQARRVDLNQPDEAIEDDFPPLIKEIRLREGHFVQDSENPNLLWIYGYGKEAWKYDAISGTFYPLPAIDCRSLHPLKRKVLIESGDSSLLILNKEDNTVDTVARPDIRRIYFAGETADLGVVVNHHQYNPATKSWLEVRQLRGITINDGFNWYAEQDSALAFAPGRSGNTMMAVSGGRLLGPIKVERNRELEYPYFWSFSPLAVTKWDLQDNITERFKLELPLFQRQFCQNDTGRIWIAAADGLFSFEKQTEEVWQYTIADQPGLLQVFVDVKHLYLVKEQGVSIYRKDYLQKKAQPFDREQYHQLTENYRAAVNKLKAKGLPFTDFLDSIRVIEQRFEAYLSAYKHWEHLNFRQEVYHSESFRKAFIRALLAEALEERYLRYNLFFLISRTAGKGEMDAVLAMDRLVQEKYFSVFESENEKRVYLEGIELIRDIQYRRDSLKKAVGSQAEYLYKEALIFTDLCKTFWYKENVCEISLAIEKMTAMIQRYPHSDFRDDAEFFIIDHRNRDAESGTVINDEPYRLFLKAYPQSNKRQPALMAILEYYAYGYIENQPDRKQKGLAVADIIVREYPALADHDRFKDYLRQLNEMESN